MKTECGSYIITVKKKVISLQTVSCGNNLPSEQKVIFNIFSKFCVRNLFPHLTIWHWWLPQSCVHICPHAGRKWEIHLNALLYSPASERRFAPSRHRFARPDRLKSVTSHPVLFSFSPDYESTGFLLWKIHGKISKFLFFFHSGMKRKTGNNRIIDDLSSDPSEATRRVALMVFV